MTKWKYMFVTVSWDKKQGKWAGVIDGKTFESFTEACNHMGSYGWELIGTTITAFHYNNEMGGTTGMTASSYVFQFKTPLT